MGTDKIIAIVNYFIDFVNYPSMRIKVRNERTIIQSAACQNCQ
jgi:hypothetical protein